MDDSKQENNPWTGLSTVSSFDRGETRITRCLNDTSVLQRHNNVIERVSPGSSLLTETLVEIICSIFESDTSKRKRLYLSICKILHEMNCINNSYKFVELDITRHHCQQKLYNLLKLAHTSIGSENVLHVARYHEPKWTRYNIEFEETGFIAAGGFGKVYKATNRLDGIEYAIKKIIIHFNRFNKHQFDEVKTLAILNHTNIIPYKSAWIEEMSILPSVPQLLSSNNNSSTAHFTDEKLERNNMSIQHTNVQQKYNDICEGNTLQELFQVSRESSSGEQIEVMKTVYKENTKESASSNSISFRSDTKDQYTINDIMEKMTENSYDLSSSLSDAAEYKQLCSYKSSVPLQQATLYIQMALCEKTLRHWLDERVGLTPVSTILSITTQILEGLNYIHSCNVVHHDIKPSNIFISTFSDGLRVQLGDFGLACALRKNEHHSVQGTHMYAAPEQLNGICNPKSDMYSLGIVLFELLVPMQTIMECSRLVELLKADMIPSDIVAKYPEWIQTLRELTHRDPDVRPTAAQLLERLRKDKDLLIIKLTDANEKQCALIKTLQDKISSLEATIASIKMQNNVLQN